MAARPLRRMPAALLAPLLLAAPLAAAQGRPAAPPSEAERLVFQHEHLAQPRPPGALHYRYVEQAEGQPGVADRAVLTLGAGPDGRCCHVHGEYLSGAQAVRLPDIPQARANPVLLYFLEGEVRRLQRTTGGQAAHFRRRIRQALADAATITEAPLRWGATTVAARTVRIAPFLADPQRARFAAQAATEYAFVLSDAVPGGVYQASAVLPGRSAGAAPLAERTLTLEEDKP